MEQKTFAKALVLISLNPKKAKTFLKDKRLTQAEKTILECFLHIRDNEYELVFEKLENFPSELAPFIKAQFCYLLGLAHNNKMDLNRAVHLFKEAKNLFAQLEQEHFHFLTCANLFVAYYNLKDTVAMKFTLDELRKFSFADKKFQLIQTECAFSYYSITGKKARAESLIEEIQSFKSEMSESRMMSHLIALFMHYVRFEDLDKASDVLAEMKNFRKYHLTENYNFMKKLLDHYRFNKPIYAYEEDFKDCPQLYHQIHVIKCLEEGHKAMALEHWSWLMKRYPSQHGPEFKFSGDKCIFSICLEKHLSKQIENSGMNVLDTDGSLLDKLEVLLQNQIAPIPKEGLYFQLWGVPPVTKEDMKKLSGLILRFKIKTGIRIKTRKGTYYIDLTDKKTA